MFGNTILGWSLPTNKNVCDPLNQQHPAQKKSCLEGMSNAQSHHPTPLGRRLPLKREIYRNLYPSAGRCSFFCLTNSSFLLVGTFEFLGGSSIQPWHWVVSGSGYHHHALTWTPVHLLVNHALPMVFHVFFPMFVPSDFPRVFYVPPNSRVACWALPSRREERLHRSSPNWCWFP